MSLGGTFVLVVAAPALALAMSPMLLLTAFVLGGISSSQQVRSSGCTAAAAERRSARPDGGADPTGSGPGHAGRARQ
ncbi:hypothetical protein JOD49_002379 [Oerskovia jenensis]|uniref:Uncharacterized protein n=1 Tax=Oerskovia jenensis TaxID=162169 RepID=A0ABS2LHW0_9CELL|nr:hypothetical protein [Oerskovia jenensis]MBM7479459.1 hypothetical protein [Oerskovia jenensis]